MNRGSSRSTGRSRKDSGRGRRLCHGCRGSRGSSSRTGSRRGGSVSRAYGTTTTWTRTRYGRSFGPAVGSSSGRSATGSSRSERTVVTTAGWAWRTTKTSHAGYRNRSRGHASNRRRMSSRSSRRSRRSGSASGTTPEGQGRITRTNRGPTT